MYYTMDGVLLDAPCSGLGMLSEKPDLKMRITEKSLDELIQLQQALLNTVCEYVKPGGTLVYSTCSVLRDEDEGQVTAFLNRHPDYGLEPVVLDGFKCENGMLRSWPHLNGNDGFFAAKMVKKND